MTKADENRNNAETKKDAEGCRLCEPGAEMLSLPGVGWPSGVSIGIEHCLTEDGGSFAVLVAQNDYTGNWGAIRAGWCPACGRRLDGALAQAAADGADGAAAPALRESGVVKALRRDMRATITPVGPGPSSPVFEMGA